MRRSSWGMPWSPKKEEQEVPDDPPDYNNITCSSSSVSDNYHYHHETDLHVNKHYLPVRDEMEFDGGGEDDIKSLPQEVEGEGEGVKTDFKYWDFDFMMSSDHGGHQLCFNEDYCRDYNKTMFSQQEEDNDNDDDEDDDEYQEKKAAASLNLSLNYQHVLDAWSNRGTLWAHDTAATLSSSNPNNSYMGEVPVMDDEERSTRREASVLRYKEKRQTRLFSKKIRYQVRKLNADKRPRLKGRFVRKTSNGD